GRFHHVGNRTALRIAIPNGGIDVIASQMSSDLADKCIYIRLARRFRDSQIPLYGESDGHNYKRKQDRYDETAMINNSQVLPGSTLYGHIVAIATYKVLRISKNKLIDAYSRRHGKNHYPRGKTRAKLGVLFRLFQCFC